MFAFNRHYPDGRTADCAYVRLDVAGFGRLAFYFRLLAAYSFVLFILVFTFLPRPKQTGKIQDGHFRTGGGQVCQSAETRAAMGYLFFRHSALRRCLHF